MKSKGEKNNFLRKQLTLSLITAGLKPKALLRLSLFYMQIEFPYMLPYSFFQTAGLA